MSSVIDVSSGAACAKPKLSIIIPVLNEACVLPALLAPLQILRSAGVELIVVDGGSSDASLEQALPWADRVELSEPGRARQMHKGAQVSLGEYLLFLHADTRLPDSLLTVFTEKIHPKAQWGRFDLRFSHRARRFAVLAWFINWRSRLTSVATGDQAIFLRRDVYDDIGGYADIPLMEDVELCKRLRKISKALCLKDCVETSSRRWEKHGFIKTIMLMWSLRLAYFCGVSASRLRRYYS